MSKKVLSAALSSLFAIGILSACGGGEEEEPPMDGEEMPEDEEGM